MHKERGEGWRGLAVRAGLMHSAISCKLLAERSSIATPRIPAFGLPSHHEKQHEGAKCRGPLSIFSQVSHLDGGVQLSGIHSVGLGTVFEAFLQGSMVHLDELRIRMSKALSSSSASEKCSPWNSAQLALCVASDLQERNRATVESMIGTKDDGHTLSGVLSSDFQTRLAWGLASSHRLGKAWTFFTRYSKDDYAGERFILQAVHELDAANKLSAVYAATIGHFPQAGFSWIHEACGNGHVNKLVSFKGLCSGDGNFSLSIKAEVGSIE